MQERHDVLTAAGFTVLHNSPRRLMRAPREVVAEVERCHVRYDGRGLPDGVSFVESPAMAV
jgi:response regulator RpfG family c-di-GMP phosphodiesterase